MIKTKIIYFILIIISIVFFILYSKPFSLYLMIFIVVFPVILGIYTIIARLCIKADIELSSDTAIKNEKIGIKIRVKNKAPISFPNNIVTIEYFNTLMNIKDNMVVSIPVHYSCTEKINCWLISEYCGIIKIRVKSVKIFDYLKLFSCRIKPEKDYSVTVLPEICPIAFGKSFNMINNDESEIFSKYKSGDDPSEIFALKDYVQGDKPNRIHWKLSLKYDDLIVKHYSQPVSSSILVILDFCEVSGQTVSALDTAAETAFSISFFLTENDIPFKFIYFNRETQKDDIIDISDEKDIAQALREVFNSGPAPETDFPISIREMIYNYSGIFYITTSYENLSKIIKDVNYEKFRPVYIQNEYEKDFKFERNNEITVIPAGKTRQFVSDIII